MIKFLLKTILLSVILALTACDVASDCERSCSGAVDCVRGQLSTECPRVGRMLRFSRAEGCICLVPDGGQ